MAKFGFRLLSGGAGPVSLTNSYICFSPANNCDQQRNLFQWFNAFNYTTTVALGYSMSAVDGGFTLPVRDTSQRALPLDWAGKRLRVEIAGSHFPLVSTRTEVKLTLSRYDAQRREITLYEDTFSMYVRGTNVGGINVEGNLSRCDLKAWNHTDVYHSIMHPFDW